MVTKIQDIINNSTNIVDDILQLPEIRKEFYSRLNNKRKIVTPLFIKNKQKMYINDKYDVSYFNLGNIYSIAIWDKISYSQSIIVYTGFCDKKNNILKNVEKWMQLTN